MSAVVNSAIAFFFDRYWRNYVTYCSRGIISPSMLMTGLICVGYGLRIGNIFSRPTVCHQYVVRRVKTSFGSCFSMSVWTRFSRKISTDGKHCARSSRQYISHSDRTTSIAKNLLNWRAVMRLIVTYSLHRVLIMTMP